MVNPKYILYTLEALVLWALASMGGNIMATYAKRIAKYGDAVYAKPPFKRYIYKRKRYLRIDICPKLLQIMGYDGLKI